MTLAGGDQNGANLRLASYSANSLNEYSSRTVPGAVDIIGSATNTATIWVDQILAYRKSNYFWLQLPLTNTSGAAYQTVTTLAALNNGYGSNAAYGSTNIGHVFLPQTPESYTYDTDGNMTQDGRWTFGWDAENRLTNLTSLAGAPVASRYKLALTYDYTGRRIQKIVSTNNGSGYVASYTNKFVYDGWNVVAILDGANNLLYSFTWGLDLSGSPQGAGGVGGLISMKVCSGTNAGTYFYCYDGNGNVAALVNAANGAIAGNWAYGPFGELIQATGPLAFINPFLFSTKYRDLETGFYYYGARYYNPSTGRWLSRDPAEEDEGGPNLYGFVGNNPINQTDILGLAFYAIDGTWAYEHPGHPELNANPWWLYRETKESRALYFRGPRFGLTGLDSKTLAQAIKKVICMDYCQAKQNGQTFTINLTGWSRGAIIAAGIAKMLNDEGCDCCGGKTAPVPVNWVGLFDACARIPFSGWWGNSVPPNVAHFDHAVKTGHSIPYPTFHFAGENAKQIYNDDGTPGGTLTTHGQVGMSKALGNENPAYPWMMGRAMQAGVKF
jgi:RHS repeat-associated protein